ncbi:hypothetical protein QX249_12910 [Vibrio parahaemolyticus]|uniref:Uncharacterized protein n=1 Tax=Vibrio parahaemolyticus TaxID=670 RepID=A0AAW8PZV8_VIBPH|nr:hypothetical protein [Vibrio parahaemolyticus]MDS1821566.1 hypothetical protein [Vibrio parahaemolyticus]
MQNHILLWLKLETGGLSSLVSEKNILGSEYYPILQVSAIITDTEMNEITTYRQAIFQESSEIDKCSDKALQMHNATGLIDEVRESGVTLKQAEIDIIELLVEAGAEALSQGVNVAFLAGQNVSAHENQFLIYQMPTLKNFLHFSNLDIAAIGLAQNLWNPESASEMGMYTDWSDDSPNAKIRRTIQSAKYYKNKIENL